MNPHLTDALARLNERRGVHWGSKVQAVTERDLAPKTRKAIDGLTEAFELELKGDGQVYLVKPGSAISADAATAQSAAATIKVVVNRCHGGFGLSEAATLAYLARQGRTAYPEPTRFGTITYWLVPPEERPSDVAPGAWGKMSLADRAAHNRAYTAANFCDRDLKRDDPDLVAVVEELGDAANDRFAKLAVVEIPADVTWKIEEYDGLEWVAEEHRTW